MKGAISSLVLARNGKQILVATHPDGDIPGSSKHPLLSLWSTQGKLIWEQRVKFPIKDVAISAGGDLIVLATHLDELIGMDSRGRRIWTTEGVCKPYVIQEPPRVVCYHDDDAGPRVAFDILDWAGKKVGQFPIQGDVVAFKFSEDQKNLAIALTGGEIVVFGADFQPVWRKKIDGEVIDLAVAGAEGTNRLAPSATPSSTPAFQVAALVRTGPKSEKIAFFGDKGQSMGQVSPTFPVEQLESSTRGDRVFYYGNSTAGQWVGSTSLSVLKEVWKQGESTFSRYSGSINLSSGLVWVGIEHSAEQSGDQSVEQSMTRESRVMVYDEAGKRVWDLGLPKDDAAYIFSHRITMVPNWFVVGTDDAKLSVYQF